jgi:alpha-galactosidase
MVQMVQALLGMGDLMTNVNVENQGQISNLPLRAVVETNALFSRDRVEPLSAGALPDGVHALVSRHSADQEMVIEAALSRDEDLAFQAVFNDPTTGLPIDQAWKMFKEIGLPEGIW